MHRDWLHVVQIALGVAASVLLVAIYVRPMPVYSSSQGDRPRTAVHQTIYLVDVKYIGASPQKEEKHL